MSRTSPAALALALLGAGLSGCSGCGPKPIVCQASTCGGCCDPSGACRLGNTPAACGFGGISCVVCDAGLSCGAGACEAAPDGGDAGELCGVLNCNGCCESDGGCRTGTDPTACGALGQACSVCPAPLGCVAFDAGTVSGGQCECGPEDCPGCCSGNDCIPITSETDQLCGVGDAGSQCVDCSPSGGTCDPTTGMCTNGSCNPTLCPTGCCESGSCQAGTDPSACGTDGQPCQICPSTCVPNIVQGVAEGGSCSGANALGGPCATDNDCASLGPGAICRQMTSTGVVYQNGYCTFDCTQTNSCPVGTCISTGGLFGETASLCWPACAGGSPCREPGYLCYSFSNGANGCWLDPPAPAGLEGAACSAGSQCVTATGPGQGFCRPATLADGGPSGFPGGECSANCTGWESADSGFGFGNVYCGDGPCIFDGIGSFFCAAGCNTPFGGQDVCRTGYVCTQTNSPPIQNFCEPACNDPGGSCPVNFICDAGYCCQGSSCL